MCGIAGFLGKPSNPNQASIALKAMSQPLIPRGPDSSGFWFESNFSVGFAHRRLSILEVSQLGSQPMSSHSNRYTLVINGEIYNHLELRKKIDGTNPTCWRGRSDTETLLAGFDTWGILKTLKKTVGMFAFAVWDHREKTLTLARDRLGEKPLYYGWHQSTFIFGSTLQSLSKHPSFIKTINPKALDHFMRFSNTPSPYSIWKNTFKLDPGECLTVKAGQKDHIKSRYWSFDQVVEKSKNKSFNGSEREAAVALEKKLIDAIDLQIIADVPVGAFLSGGIDSSLIVALMQRRSSQAIKTYSIGFHEQQYNEAHHAKVVAKQLNTDHSELYLSKQDALSLIPQLPQIYDEPFADSSQIPTFLVSKLARQSVKVSLSGDGGDEIFGGYNRYLFTENLWKHLSNYPSSLRALCKKAFDHPFLLRRSGLADQVFEKTRLKKIISNPLDKAAKLLKVIDSKSLESLYLGITSSWGRS